MNRIALVALLLLLSPALAQVPNSGGFGVPNGAAGGSAIVAGQLPGTATNDNASVGNVGQYASSIVLSGAAVALTSGSPADVTTLQLPAGDWDLQGICASQPAGGAVTTVYVCNVTTTANTLNNIPSDGGGFGFNNSTQSSNGGQAVPTDTARVSISSSTTYHLVASVTWTTGTMGAYGKLRARRVR